MLISDIVRRNAEYFGDCDAVVVPGGVTVSWAELEERSNALARAFLELGLRKGDRVATFMSNCLEFYDFFFACGKTGIIGAPTNVRLAPSELASYLSYVGPSAILVHARVEETARRFIDEVPSLRHVIGVGDGHTCALDAAALRGAQPTTDPGCHVDETDAYQLAATSGTTGTPKAAIGTHRNALAGIVTWCAELGSGERETNLQVIPMFFNPGGQSGLHYVFLKGGRSVLIEPFDPSVFLAAIEQYRANHSIIVPTMVSMLLDHPDCGKHDYSSLRGIGSGGSPLPRTVLARAREVFGDVMYGMYGMAETYSVGLILRRENQFTKGPPEVVARLASAGKPMIYMQARVVDDDGNDVRRDNTTPGEIWMKGDSISSGYFRMPEETAHAWHGEWLKTGDVAVVDAEGFITIVDRKKDIIITGGINVFSRDIEEALYQHPAVAQAAAIGIPHPTWGEAIHAVVTLKPDAQATPDELIEFAAERLAGFKKPRSLDIVDELPISGTGKILKKELRARYLTAGGER